MAVPNDKLRAAREAMPSRTVPGEPMRRAELAEAVNAYLWEASNKRRRSNLDDHTIGRYERGEIRWPSEPYRRGLRAVLNASADDELGFRPTRRGNTASVAAAPASPAVGYGGAVDLGMRPVDFLAHISVETPISQRIGWTEVENIRVTTRAVAMSENLYGGGLSCEAALAQLRWSGRHLDATAASEVRRAMFEAVGNLSLSFNP